MQEDFEESNQRSQLETTPKYDNLKFKFAETIPS